MLRSSLFLVRVWRQRDHRGVVAFRACVRAVDAERGRLFTRPSELVRYLARNGWCNEAHGHGAAVRSGRCDT